MLLPMEVNGSHDAGFMTEAKFVSYQIPGTQSSSNYKESLFYSCMGTESSLFFSFLSTFPGLSPKIPS